MIAVFVIVYNILLIRVSINGMTNLMGNNVIETKAILHAIDP